MKKVVFSSRVEDYFNKASKKDQKLLLRIQKKLKLFIIDPTHPSLRLHKISGGSHVLWSISITMSIRMIYTVLNEETVLFTDIGTHDEVYSK